MSIYLPRKLAETVNNRRAEEALRRFLECSTDANLRELALMAMQRADRAEHVAEACRQEARCWRQEARCLESIVRESNRAAVRWTKGRRSELTGRVVTTGIPSDWHGSAPVREALRRLGKAALFHHKVSRFAINLGVDEAIEAEAEAGAQGEEVPRG